MVVPSKFFGALSAGRPVLFVGDPESSVAKWIREFRVGWVLNNENQRQVAQDLLAYANSPEKIDAMQKHCFAVYRAHFSRKEQIDHWNRSLQSLLNVDLSHTAIPPGGSP